MPQLSPVNVRLFPQFEVTVDWNMEKDRCRGACACVSAGGGGSGRDDKEKEAEIHRLTYGKDGRLSVVELLAWKRLQDMLVCIRGWTEAATEANDKLVIKDIKCGLNKLTCGNNLVSVATTTPITALSMVKRL